MVMLKRFRSDKRGAAEIVGTVLFLVILLFFFTNVFLWQDQVSREMDQVTGDRLNSGLRVTAFSNSTDNWLVVDNVGGLDITLSRLWILTDEYHQFADFEPLNVHVKAGTHMNITFSGVPVPGAVEGSVHVDLLFSAEESADGSAVYLVDYGSTSGESVVFRVLTVRANSAACELQLE
jgi:hypothetical protein